MSELKIENDKILVGVPLERFTLNEFMHCRDAILHSLNTDGRCAIPSLYQVQGHRVDRNRDDLVEYFLNHPEKPDWLLMLDSDMEHPASIGQRLTRWRKPIVGGLYFHRGDHRPLVFRKGTVAKNRWGQDVVMSEYMDDEVWDYLTKHNIPMRDGAMLVDGVDEESLIECDYVATGSMAIHRSVLEAMKPPWFQYQDGTRSEDLEFCDRARELGFPIYCDLSTMSGHFNLVGMGHTQFRMYIEGRGMSYTSYGSRDAAMWLAEDMGISQDEALQKLKDYHPRQLAEHWNAFGTNGAESVNKFYTDPKTGELYLLDLLRWNSNAPFQFIRKQLTGLRRRKVVEIGAGIGTVALQLMVQGNDVTAVEPNDRLRAFMERRYTRSVEAKVLPKTSGTFEAVPAVSPRLVGDKGAYDVAVAIDVMEHLHPDALPQMLENIAYLLKINGRLFTHNNWWQQDLYPMHYNHEAIWQQCLAAVGMHMLDEMWAVKVSEGALVR